VQSEPGTHNSLFASTANPAQPTSNEPNCRISIAGATFASSKLLETSTASSRFTENYLPGPRRVGSPQPCRQSVMRRHLGSSGQRLRRLATEASAGVRELGAGGISVYRAPPASRDSRASRPADALTRAPTRAGHPCDTVQPRCYWNRSQDCLRRTLRALRVPSAEAPPNSPDPGCAASA